MYLRRSATLKYFLAALAGAVLYCEWVIYLMQPRYWDELDCRNYDSTCTKILFIADPQIQGDTDVSPPLSYLFNWDSDRYLQSTFSVVLKYFRPDVLVFLGDLMDEGSISTMEQFHAYVKRLSDIFYVDYPVVQVWIPGDNDIGGENEPVNKEKVLEFEKVFDQPSVVTFRNVSFYKVNAITHTLPIVSNTGQDKHFRIVVSHYPVTFRRAFSKQVSDRIHPNIFFSAHEHEAKYVKQNKEFMYQETTLMTERDKPLEIGFSEDQLYEILVPTCSYRMGTSQIGFGAAVLENNNHHMRYTVFWSPTRFPYLFIYLIVLIIISVYTVVFCAAKIFLRKSSSKSSVDKVPLFD